MTRRERPSFEIRPYRPGDASKLRELAIGMDVQARVRLGVDRGKDWHAFNRVRYEAWDTLVVEQDDRLVGFLDMGYSRYRVGDQTVLGFYAGLAGVRAGFRGTPIFVRLGQAGIDLALERGVRLGLSIANTRQQNIPRLLQRRYPRAIRGSLIYGRCILLGPAYPFTRRYEIRSATPDDLPELSDLVRRTRSRYLVSTTLEPADLERLPGMRIEDLLLIRRHGKIVASLGLWDQDALRRVVVCGYGQQERWLRSAFARVRGLTGVTPFPKEGEPLRLLHTVFAAAEPGQEHVWGALLRHACRHARGSGHHLLIVGLPETSRLRPACKGLPGFTNVNVTLVIGWDDEVDKVLHSVPTPSIRHEYALV